MIDIAWFSSATWIDSLVGIGISVPKLFSRKHCWLKQLPAPSQKSSILSLWISVRQLAQTMTVLPVR